MSAIHFLKRLYTEVASRTKEGRPYKVKYKVIDENTISLTGPDTANVKLTITPEPSYSGLSLSYNWSSNFLHQHKHIQLSPWG